MKINKRLLPVKLHFFFFFAALGPLLPQLYVFGRQLGASASTMGFVSAVLPILWAVAKPVFGYIVDYFTNQRKLIFMLLIVTMTGSFCALWFLPEPVTKTIKEEHIYNPGPITLKNIGNVTFSRSNVTLERLTCHWSCDSDMTVYEFYISNETDGFQSIYVNETPNLNCSLFNMNFGNITEECFFKMHCHLICSRARVKREIQNSVRGNEIQDSLKNETVKRFFMENSVKEYSRSAFWIFVVLYCIGIVAFNVSNCIADAVSFDVLGSERAHKYGSQRAWGTVGYGLTALVGGYLIDLYSTTDYKDFTPAFLLALVFTVFDLFSASKLKLPRLSSPSDSGKALYEVLRLPRVVVFIIFAVVVGTFDSFIIYYTFWFLEELAETTGHSANVKFIEGVIVAAESLFGELLFFMLAGKIINRVGFGWAMTLSLPCYALRLLLTSIITNPWQLVLISGVLQGPTYALCYSCIVGYAAQVAPEGYSATVQGVVAGVDDGLGFAIGSLLGGLLYTSMGARESFQVMAVAALAATFIHGVLFKIYGEEVKEKKQPITEDQLTVEESKKMLEREQEMNTVYRDTTVPITQDIS